MADHGYEVGQEVIYVSREPRDRDVTWTIEKIGRKWAYCGFNKSFCLETGKAKPQSGHSSAGQVWRSQSDLDVHREIASSWREFRAFVTNTYLVPAHLSAADITDILNKLKGAE